MGAIGSKKIMGKLQLYGIVFVVVSGIIGAIWLHGYTSGKQSVKVKVLERAVTVTEKRNEIANNRPDDSATINRLRNGSF